MLTYDESCIFIDDILLSIDDLVHAKNLSMFPVLFISNRWEGGHFNDYFFSWEDLAHLSNF